MKLQYVLVWLLTIFACICQKKYPNGNKFRGPTWYLLIFAAFPAPKVSTLCQSTESIGCSETPSPDHRSRIKFTVWWVIDALNGAHIAYLNPWWISATLRKIADQWPRNYIKLPNVPYMHQSNSVSYTKTPPCLPQVGYLFWHQPPPPCEAEWSLAASGRSHGDPTRIETL